MQTVGHRGASALAPENTLLAIRVAIAHRLDYVEVDVHLSRDGQLVVHHDAQVVDQNGVRMPVAELTAAELARIPKGDDQVVPTLAQVLALAADRIGVYIELKAAGTADALGTLLRDWTDAPRLICGSFVPELVAEARRAAPDVPRSVLFRQTPRPTMIETCWAVAARYAHPCARPIGPGMIAELHAAELLVMTPHTNSHLEAERFRRAGADLVASDDPRLLAEISRRATKKRRDYGDRRWRRAGPKTHDPARLRPPRGSRAPDARLNAEVAP
ncbi:MAG: glycerophosphodiester phosphodiesterase [Chloroflexota bacterium]|nr:glycerophosphodiester phosphodiesterase [Chloroflexota bacterium]